MQSNFCAWVSYLCYRDSYPPPADFLNRNWAPPA